MPLGVRRSLVAKLALVERSAEDGGGCVLVAQAREQPFWRKLGGKAARRLETFNALAASIFEHAPIDGVERVWIVGESACIPEAAAQDFKSKWARACGLPNRDAVTAAKDVIIKELLAEYPPVPGAATLLCDAFRDGLPAAIGAMRSRAGLRGAIITGDQRETAQRMLGRVAGVACRGVEGTTMLALATQLEDAIASQYWITDTALTFDRPQIKLLELAAASAARPLWQRALQARRGCEEQIHLADDAERVMAAFRRIFGPNRRAAPGLPLRPRPFAAFCSALPAQKASIVRLFQLHALRGSEREIFVGDGMNDLPAIEAARVSYGILGEGGQAYMRASVCGTEWAPLAKLVLEAGPSCGASLALMAKAFCFKQALTGMALWGWLIYSAATLHLRPVAIATGGDDGAVHDTAVGFLARDLFEYGPWVIFEFVWLGLAYGYVLGTPNPSASAPSCQLEPHILVSIVFSEIFGNSYTDIDY